MNTQNSRQSSFASSQSHSFHMANPNPQNPKRRYKFKGARELGYSICNKESDPTDIVKFGKKAFFGGDKLSNEETMEAHLNQIRQNRESKSAFNHDKLNQEKEFIDNVRQMDQLENHRNYQGKKAINE